MNFKQDIITHTFRNKYLKYTGGGYITSKSSSSTDQAAALLAKWFYEDDEGSLHSKLDFVSDLGLTAYGLGNRTPSTILDGLLIDETTLSKEGGKLSVIGGTGGGGVSNWEDLEGKPTWITDAKPVYNWSEIVSKPETFTPSSHTHIISNITNLQTTLDNKSNLGHIHNISDITNLQSLLDSKLNSSSYTANDVLSKMKSVDGSGSGLDADLLDGKHYTDIVNGNVASATKLQTPRTIWGKSFDGTANVSGDMNNVGNITQTNSTSCSIGNSAGTFYRSEASAGHLILSSNGNGNIAIRTGGTNGNDRIYIASDSGNVGIGTSSPSQKLHVSGNILATGGVTCYSSDARAKTIIEELNLSLKQISESPTIRFKWNGWNVEDDGKTHIGGIAQYVQNILPEAVLDANGILNMDYATTAYIYAVQTARHLEEANKEIASLKQQIALLKDELKLIHNINTKENGSI